MPETVVVYCCEEDGTVPVLEGLDGLSRKARIECIGKIERLRGLGHELRRPEADILRDGIYELRIDLARDSLPTSEMDIKILAVSKTSQTRTSTDGRAGYPIRLTDRPPPVQPGRRVVRRLRGDEGSRNRTADVTNRDEAENRIEEPPAV